MNPTDIDQPHEMLFWGEGRKSHRFRLVSPK